MSEFLSLNIKTDNLEWPSRTICIWCKQSLPNNYFTNQECLNCRPVSLLIMAPQGYSMRTFGWEYNYVYEPADKTASKILREQENVKRSF